METELTDQGRSLVLVEGHRPVRKFPGPRTAGLRACVAMVLSTYRPGASELVLDHELWLTCIGAVSEVVGATEAEVMARPRRRFLWDRRPGPGLGPLAEYGVRLLNDPDPEKSLTDSWAVIQWRDRGTLVAWADREDWFAVGGPGVYHDSYTTGIRVRASDVPALVEALLIRARGAGAAAKTVP